MVVAASSLRQSHPRLAVLTAFSENFHGVHTRSTWLRTGPMNPEQSQRSHVLPGTG